jgi:hypothetical protein
VDYFFRQPKELAGDGDFVPTEQPDEYEWRRFLIADGVVANAELRAIAYPDTRPREFRLLIIHGGHCVCRIDCVYGRDGPHINDFNRPMGYPSLPIRTPHFHPWDGNRHLSRVDTYPSKLLYAFEIDDKICQLDRAFKWLCDESSIAFTSDQVPDWPSRVRLL